MQKDLIIIGAGAHARVVLEAALLQGVYNIKGFCADDLPVGSIVFENYTILDNAMLANLNIDTSIFFIVAIGNIGAKELFFENALKKFSPAIIIHPKSSVSISATIGDGAIILSNACINSASRIGKNTIVNIGVLVDHDCIIGSNVHLEVGTIVGCRTEIENNYVSEQGQLIKPFSKVFRE